MKKIFYGIIIGDTLLAVVFILAFLIPLTSSIRRHAENFQEKRLEFERLQGLKNELFRFQEFALERASDVAALHASFIDPNTPLGLVKFLEEGAAKEDVRITIAPGVVKKEGPLERSFLEFQVQGAGAYRGVVNLLGMMERAPFAVSLVSASVQESAQGVRLSVVLKALAR